MAETLQSRSRTGWREEETQRLFQAVENASREGSPLRHVFEDLSGELGRKPNSIRNYYYARLHSEPDGAPVRAAPFRTFTDGEVHELLRQVLMARGRGMSVRACVMAMSGGDHSRMLRFQNKYRTLIHREPQLVERVCEELRAAGLPCPDHPLPSESTAVLTADNVEMQRLLAEPAVAAMLGGIKELLRRASRPSQAPELQRQVDRMQVQQDLRRLSWEKDFDEATAHLQQLLALLRDFLALPHQSQQIQLDAFRDEALSRISQAEIFLSRAGAE